MRWILAVASLCAAACSTSVEPFDATAFPVDGDFYVPPADLSAGDAGDVIWVDELSAPRGVSAWNVLYRSEGLDGDPIAVSGWIAVSPAPQPHRILVVAHPTTGLGDQCAPTRLGTITPSLFADHLAAGWTVAFTDYQGLGTPGLHHYLVAEAEARSLLDIARAARIVDGAASEVTALYGFSQGGHAVLAAAELAGELAPELEIVGMAAAAPAILLREWVAEGNDADIGYLAMIGAAYIDAYDHPVDEWFTAEAQPALEQVTTGCYLDAQQAFGGLGGAALATDAAVGTVPGDALEANDVGSVALEAPLLLMLGGNDDLFSPVVAERVIERLCEAGTNVTVLRFADATHAQLWSLGRGPALAWLEGDEVAGLEPACTGT